LNCQQVINLARRHFVTFDEQEALTYLQAVHNKILRLVRVKVDENVDLNMVAGTPNYAISSEIMRIWSVTAYDDVGMYRALRPKSVDELDYTYPVWKSLNSGQPIWYDERAGEMIFYPTPNVTTVAGYPIIRLRVQKTDTLTMSTTLPTMVDEYDAWIYGLCRKYATEKEKDQLPFFEQKYKQALRDLEGYSQGKAVRGKPALHPVIPIPRTS
jgi:hypothetical protein